MKRITFLSNIGIAYELLLQIGMELSLDPHEHLQLKLSDSSNVLNIFSWSLSFEIWFKLHSDQTVFSIDVLKKLNNISSLLADMLNHSFQPNCFFHWRFKDRMLEVLINAGQQIKKGDEVCLTCYKLWSMSIIFTCLLTGVSWEWLLVVLKVKLKH